MKFLYFVILFLFLQRGIFAEETDILGQKPFSYDGPFRRQFNFDFLLKETDEEKKDQEIITNQQVNEPVCISNVLIFDLSRTRAYKDINLMKGFKIDEEQSNKIFTEEVFKRDGLEHSSMKNLKCKKKIIPGKPYAFECKDQEKKYFNKDRLDSKLFYMYLSPQKEISHISNAARYTLKQFDMMAGFPLPWSCIFSEKLENNNEEKYLQKFKQKVENELGNQQSDSNIIQPKQIFLEDVKKYTKQQEEVTKQIEKITPLLEKANKQQEPNKAKKYQEELQKLQLEQKQLQSAIDQTKEQINDLSLINNGIQHGRLYKQTYNIQGEHETLKQSLKVYEAEASGNKASILRKTLITSILLKKMWVLISTQGGMKPYQCPNLQIDTILEEENKFVESALDFDDTTNNLFYQIKANLFHERTKEIKHAKRDSINDNVTENYDPNKEIQELSEPTIDDYDSDKYNFNLPNPLETLDYIRVDPKQIGKHCDPSIFKQTSFFNYNIGNESFGFKSKASIELVQFVFRKSKETEDPGDSNVVPKENDLDFSQFKNQFNENIKLFPQFEGKEGNIHQQMEEYHKGGLKDIEEQRKEDEENQDEKEKQNDTKAKQKSDVDQKEEHIDYSRGFQRLSGFSYNMLRYIQGVVQFTDRRYIYRVRKKIKVDKVIELLSDRTLLLDTIFDKYKGQKKEAEMTWNVDEEIMKIKAIYNFNYTRMLEFLFHELKFSPLAMPQSVDMVRKSKKVFEELKSFEIYEELMHEFRIEDQEKLIQSMQVRAEVFDRPGKDPKILNVGTIIKKVTNDLYAILKQKEFLIFKSFLTVMEDMLVNYFSPYVVLTECFRPHPKLEMKNKCPTVFREMIKFIGSHPEATVDFTQFYNILNGYLSINPQKMHKYMDTFLNFMFIYSKFELNKLEFFGETGSLEDEIKYMVEQYMSTQHIPNVENNYEKISKKHYLAYVYASTLQDLGQNIPEYTEKYIDFLERLQKVSDIPMADHKKEEQRVELMRNPEKKNFDPFIFKEKENSNLLI